MKFKEERKEYSKKRDQHLDRRCNIKKPGSFLDLKMHVMAGVAKIMRQER